MKNVGERWKVIKEIILPQGTKRRRVYDLAVISFRYIRNRGFINFIKKVLSKITVNLKNSFIPKVPNIYRIERKPYRRVNQLTYFPTVDIVIVTFNSENFIENCLLSLTKLNYKLDRISIIIVDNCSVDLTAEKVKAFIQKYKKFFKDLIFIQNTKNIGFGAGVNQGVDVGDGEYLFILNPDTKVKEDSLTILLEYAVEDKECAIWEARQLPYEHPKFYDPLTFETIWSSGAAFLMRREIFEKVGGFDEEYFLYVEDVDLSFKVRTSGYCVRYIPEAVVWHFSYLEPNEFKFNQFFYSISNNLIIRLKFGRFKEVFFGWLMLIRLFLKGDSRIPNSRRVILKMAILSFKKSLKIIFKKTSSKIFKNYKFFGWNYEYRKLGSFFYQKLPKSFPKVSVIVRSIGKNPKMVKEALFSILNQTYKNLEVILIEDGSNNLGEIVEYFINKGLDIKYIYTKERLGRSRAGNLGLSYSSGRFLNFLDEDDLIYPTHIEILVSYLAEKSNFKAAYSASLEAKILIIDPKNYRYVITKLSHFFNDFNKEALIQRNLFPIQAVMFHRSLYENYGGFREDLELLEDWELWVRYSEFTKFLPLRITTSEFRVPASLKEAELRLKKLSEYEKIVREKYIP